MNLTVIKSNFHQLIDTIQDKELLLQFLGAMEYSSSRKKGELWNSLTQKQKENVLASYEESFDEENLISMDIVAEKHKKWLTK